MQRPPALNIRLISATGLRPNKDTTQSTLESATGSPRSAFAKTHVAAGQPLPARVAASLIAGLERSMPQNSTPRSRKSAGPNEPSPQPRSKTRICGQESGIHDLRAVIKPAPCPRSSQRCLARTASRVSPGLDDFLSCGCVRFQ